MKESTAAPAQGMPSEIPTVARYDFLVVCRPPDEDDRVGAWWEEYEGGAVNMIRDALEADFASEVQYIFQGLVDVRITRLEQGSIKGTVVLVLAAGMSLCEFTAHYRDFRDTLGLLRQHLRCVVDRVLRGAMPTRYYRLNVSLTRVPILEPPTPTRPARPELPPLYSRAFFWYLLFMNLVRMVIIAILVYRAVAIAYFWTP